MAYWDTEFVLPGYRRLRIYYLPCSFQPFIILKVKYVMLREVCHCFNNSQLGAGSQFLHEVPFFKELLFKCENYSLALICLTMILPFCLVDFINFHLGGFRTFHRVEISFHYLDYGV